ncbi:hypothetical protein F5I97DRAFT_1971899 [Phlebopus sp. FC_14]|nr:hypothetical protein F5I97DRAFT_1971899 [Phlebopus sp. FC_14]
MSGPDISQLGSWGVHQNSTQGRLRNPTSSSPSDGVQSQPPVQHHRYDVIDQTLHLDDILREERAGERALNNGFESPTSLESSKAARLNGLVYTPSISSDSEKPSLDQLSSLSTPEISELQFVQPTTGVELPMLHPCAKSPVNIARFQFPSSTRASRVRSDTSLVSKKEPEIIDLTGCEESEDEAAVNEMLRDGGSRHVTKQNNPSTSRGRSPSSPSLAGDRFLFTPLPPRRRRRMLMDYVAVPSLQNGLTKDDYHPMPEARVALPIQTPGKRSSFDHDDMPFIPSEKRKWKERERDTVSSPAALVRRKRKRRPTTTFGVDIDTSSNALLDAYYAHTALPIGDVNVYPPLSLPSFVADTRFAFAHAWRKNAARLPLTRKASGDVASEEKPTWELVSGPHKITGTRCISGATAGTAQMQDQISIMEDAGHEPHASTANPLAPSCDQKTSALPTLPDDQGPAVDIDADVDMDEYFNDLGDSPSKTSQRDISSPTQSFHPMIHLTGPSLFNTHTSSFSSDPVLSAQREGRDSFLGLPPSPSAAETVHPQDTDPFVPPPLQPEDCVIGDDNFTHVHSGSPTHTNTWSLNETGSLQQDGDSLTTPPTGESASIAFSTINPSLLGGEQIPEPVCKPAIAEPQSKLPEPIVYIRRPLHSSGLSVATGGKRAVQIKYRDQDLPATTENVEDRVTPVTASKGKGKKKERTPADLIRSDAKESVDVVETQAVGSSQEKRTRLPSYKIRISKTSITSVESDSVPSPASERLSASLPPSNTDQPKVKLKQPRKTADVEEIAVENTFCHQCRNTTTRPKMQCSNKLRDGRVCGKRFCQRCILRRYPDITFDQFTAGFMCPMCTNTCNCSTCCKKRGEEFISMRDVDFVGSRIRSRVVFVPDEPKSTHESRLGRNTNETLQMQESKTTFWAHVYGMEGERVGSAFIGPEHAASLSNSAPGQPPAKPPRPKKPKPPRIFIGHPRKSWKIRSVRDLDPPADSQSASSSGNKGEGKGKGADGRPLRLYIGDPTFLHRPFERMPVLPTSSSFSRSSPEFESDGTLTPLSELEDGYWPQPNVGESCLWQPPPPNPDGEQQHAMTTLSDEQVARAIHVALAAVL